ncbi:hypothetical protein MSAN_01857400 [Mycena sanguinolenta]|uniref:Uncharacterized protein n=1 Tax=Mycena sanguinolenta TaxID=230812 RepID=A0A8H7CQD0_9AGAR|nr:hypothetical protein MSAN_01857400 [Mycena sanguinolenta]
MSKLQATRTSKIRTRSPEAKRKRRERDAKRRQLPGVLEKQRLVMAERRAAIKARRRQWDPPKISRPPTAPRRNSSASISLRNSETPEADLGDTGLVAMTLTPAEQFAVGVLAEMAAVRSTDGPVLGYGARHLISESASDFSSVSSLSFGSSNEAVFEERVRSTLPYGTYANERLPPYVTPPTRLQKKIWRDLGKIGPLTSIQEDQLIVTKLADPMTKREWREFGDAFQSNYPVVASHLSSERRRRIHIWRRQSVLDTTWDENTQREFAEAAMVQRGNDLR